MDLDNLMEHSGALGLAANTPALWGPETWVLASPTPVLTDGHCNLLLVRRFLQEHSTAGDCYAGHSAAADHSKAAD